MSTRIKICGITRSEDALAASQAGAHAIGLMFSTKSPRHIGIEQALAIRQVLPPFVSVVAVFMDASADEVGQTIARTRPDLLQFHGSEPEAFCAGFALPFLKAIPMSDSSPEKLIAAYPRAAGFLLDSHAQGEAGGTGIAFDWNRVPNSVPAPIILAGGLVPANVADAIRRLRPYAVDVSSGVESAPGIKDAALMKAFVSEVRRGNHD